MKPKFNSWTLPLNFCAIWPLFRVPCSVALRIAPIQNQIMIIEIIAGTYSELRYHGSRDNFLLTWLRSVNHDHLMRFNRFENFRTITFSKEPNGTKTALEPNTIDRMISLLWHFQLAMLNVPSSESKLIIVSKYEWVMLTNKNVPHGNDIVKHKQLPYENSSCWTNELQLQHHFLQFQCYFHSSTGSCYAAVKRSMLHCNPLKFAQIHFSLGPSDFLYYRA